MIVEYRNLTYKVSNGRVFRQTSLGDWVLSTRSLKEFEVWAKQEDQHAERNRKALEVYAAKLKNKKLAEVVE